MQKHNHEVVPIKIGTGIINGLEIILDKPIVPDVDTVTLYVGPQNQNAWKEYMLSLKPKRVIFNPGTENPEFEKQLQEHSIEPVSAPHPGSRSTLRCCCRTTPPNSLSAGGSPRAGSTAE